MSAIVLRRRRWTQRLQAPRWTENNLHNGRDAVLHVRNVVRRRRWTQRLQASGWTDSNLHNGRDAVLHVREVVRRRHGTQRLQASEPSTNIGISFRSCPDLHAAQLLEAILHRGHVALTARHTTTNVSTQSHIARPTSAMRGARIFLRRIPPYPPWAQLRPSLVVRTRDPNVQHTRTL